MRWDVLIFSLTSSEWSMHLLRTTNSWLGVWLSLGMSFQYPYIIETERCIAGETIWAFLGHKNFLGLTFLLRLYLSNSIKWGEIVIYENMPVCKYRVIVNALRKVLPHVPCCSLFEFPLQACILAPHNRHQRDIFPTKSYALWELDSSIVLLHGKWPRTYIAQTKKEV